MHRPTKWPRLLLLEILALTAAGGTTALAEGLSPARQAELTNLIRQDCGSCHGMTLKGGLGRPIRPSDLSGIGEEALAEVILDGVPGTPMPPWRGLLSETEARWIAQSLKTGLEE
jgi:cytochrome c55X